MSFVGVDSSAQDELSEDQNARPATGGLSLIGGTSARAPSTDGTFTFPKITANSPLIVIPEDSNQPHVLCISPHGNVQAVNQIDLLQALTVSKDEQMPDDVEHVPDNSAWERAAFKNCMGALKAEVLKTKYLRNLLNKSEDLQQRKDVELRSITEALQRQQAVFAQQCKTVRKREETITRLQAELDKKETALLGMEYDRVWSSNILNDSELHAQALKDISDRLLSIETPQKRPTVSSPEPSLQTGDRVRSPLFHVKETCSPLKRQGAEGAVGGEVETPIRRGVGCGYGAGSDEGDENAAVDQEAASVVQTPGSTSGRKALGVLYDVQNVLGQGGNVCVSNTEDTREAEQQDSKKQNEMSSCDTDALQKIQGELENANFQAAAVAAQLGEAQQRIAELQDQCKQLHTEVEETKSYRVAEMQRLEQQAAFLQRKLGKKEQLDTAEYEEMAKSFFLLDGMSDTPVSQMSSVFSPASAQEKSRRADSPEALQGDSPLHPGLWERGVASRHLQALVDDTAPVPASQATPPHVQQAVTSSKSAAASNRSQPSSLLKQTAPRLMPEPQAELAGPQAASGGTADAFSDAELHEGAILLQEAFQGRLRAATAEPDALSDQATEHSTVRAFVHRLQEHLSCSKLEELEEKVYRLSAYIPTVEVGKAAGAAVCDNAQLSADRRGAEKTTDRRDAATDTTMLNSERLDLKSALEDERRDWMCQLELHMKERQDLLEQLQQTELQLQGLAEVQEMTAAELAEARAERDVAVTAQYQPAAPEPRPVLVEQGVCTEALTAAPEPRPLLVEQGVCTEVLTAACTVDQGMCTDPQSPPRVTGTAESLHESQQLLSVLHVAEPPPLQLPLRLSPAKSDSMNPAGLDSSSGRAPQQPVPPQWNTGPQGMVHADKGHQMAVAQQGDAAPPAVQVLEDKIHSLCKERDAASLRAAELEVAVTDLQTRCAVLKQRADDSERALRELWPAVQQEVQDINEKCRNAETELAMCKAYNEKLHSHLENAKGSASQPATRPTSPRAANSDMGPQHIEEARTCTSPRSNILLQMLQNSQEGQHAARSAADVAENELRSVRCALRAAESQATDAIKRANDLAQQLNDEKCKSKDLREQSRRLTRQVQGQLQHPVSYRRPSTTNHSPQRSLATSPRHGCFKGPLTPFDGVRSTLCPTASTCGADGMDEPCMQRCESAPLPHGNCPHTGSAAHSASSQACDGVRPQQQQERPRVDDCLHPDPVSRARLTVHAPRGRLDLQGRASNETSRRSASLPPCRDTHPGDSSPLCNAVSALAGPALCTATKADDSDTRMHEQDGTEGSCMTCQELQFHVGKLEEQLAAADMSASAVQVDHLERESTLAEELQRALSVRNQLQSQLEHITLDLHHTSQQRDLAFEQLSQFVAGPGMSGSADAACSGACEPAGSTPCMAASEEQAAEAANEEARIKALQELQSMSAKADRLQRDLEASEACVASLRADVARADAAAADASLVRKQAVERSALAESDLAAAQTRLAAVERQDGDCERLNRRWAESEQRVRSLESQLEKVRTEVAEMKKERDEAMAQASKLSSRMKEAASREEEARTARDTISADLASLRAQLAESAAEASRVWDECTDLRLRLSKSEDSVHSEQSKAQEACSAASRLQQQLQDARKDIEAARQDAAEADRCARAAEARLKDAEDAAAAARQDADSARSSAERRLQDSARLARNAQDESTEALESAVQRADDAVHRLRIAESAKQAATQQCETLRERASVAEAALSRAQQASATAAEAAKSDRQELLERVEAAEAAQQSAERDARAARCSAEEAQECLQAATTKRERAERAAEADREEVAAAQRCAHQAEERAGAAEAVAWDLRKQLAVAHADVAAASAAAATAASAAASMTKNDEQRALAITASAEKTCAECAVLRSSLQQKEDELRELRDKHSNMADAAASRSGDTLQLREQLATAECDVLELKAEVRKAQEQASIAEQDARDSADAATKAGEDTQAAANQAASARADALAAAGEAEMHRAAADAATARERQLQDSVKRLTAEVEKWKAAAQATQDRLRSSFVAAGAADGDAREAKDALKALQAELASSRRRERAARVEVAQLRAKLRALDDFAGDQFEASLCATPSCNTLAMSANGDETSVAGDGAACSEVESCRHDAHATPVKGSFMPYRSVPLQRRCAVCNISGAGGRQDTPEPPAEDSSKKSAALVLAAESSRGRNGDSKGNGERQHGAVSRQVLRCLHRALCGLCAAMPEVYAASSYWAGLDSHGSRNPDEQAQLQLVIGTAGDLLETSNAEAAIAGLSSNNQVCLKAAVAVGRLRRYSQTLAARLQSADLRAAQLLNCQGSKQEAFTSNGAARHGPQPGNSCSAVVLKGGKARERAEGWRRGTGASSSHAWEGKGSCSPRLKNLHPRSRSRGTRRWDGDLTFAIEGVQGNDVDVDDTVSDFLGSIASQAAL